LLVLEVLIQSTCCGLSLSEFSLMRAQKRGIKLLARGHEFPLHHHGKCLSED